MLNHSGIYKTGWARQRAVTLMELIASVAIMAILVVGALTLYGSAQTGSNTTQLTRDLTGVMSSTKSLFAGQFNYGTAVLNTTLIAARAIPSSWTVSGGTAGTITHQMNGTVTVTGKGAAGFEVALTAIPQAICVKLLANNSNTGWDSIVVGSTTITTFPISPVTAATACAAGDNIITFKEAP